MIFSRTFVCHCGFKAIDMLLQYACVEFTEKDNSLFDAIFLCAEKCRARCFGS
jgi:hypothetical protein